MVRLESGHETGLENEPRRLEDAAKRSCKGLITNLIREGVSLFVPGYHGVEFEFEAATRVKVGEEHLEFGAATRVKLGEEHRWTAMVEVVVEKPEQEERESKRKKKWKDSFTQTLFVGQRTHVPEAIRACCSFDSDEEVCEVNRFKSQSQSRPLSSLFALVRLPRPTSGASLFRFGCTASQIGATAWFASAVLCVQLGVFATQ